MKVRRIIVSSPSPPRMEGPEVVQDVPKMPWEVVNYPEEVVNSDTVEKVKIPSGFSFLVSKENDN